MEFGFNCKTHKVEKMYDYNVITYMFDYDEQYLDRELNEGIMRLESIMKYLLAQIDQGNTHIVIQLQNKEELTNEDYLTLFSTFGVLLANRGRLNNKGYLNANETLREKMGGTNFAKVAILNHDFDYGIIQLTIEDEKGYSVKWINQVK